MNYLSINKLSTLPLYKQIASSFETAILNGVLSHGALLPTEREICDAFSISATVVKMAYEELLLSGHIIRIKGKGTYVSHRPLLRMMMDDIVWIDEYEGSEQEKIQIRVVMIDRVKDEFINHLLKRSPDEHCYLLLRVVFYGLTPVSLQKIYLPALGLTKRNLLHNQTLKLRELITLGHKNSIGRCDHAFSILNLDGPEAALLEVEKDAPGHFLRTRINGKNGHILAYVTQHFPGESIEGEMIAHVQ
jgi:GntR family transcriptional regulator